MDLEAAVAEMQASLGQGKSIGPTLMYALRDASEASIYVFAKGVLGYTKFSEKIHLPICKLLEDLTNRRLKILLPRGWYKTTLTTVSYPLWRATKNPDLAILIAQNTYENALAKLASIDAHVTGNAIYRALWPEVLPDKSCSWTANSKSLRRKSPAPEGTFDCAGIRTQVVGRHYNIIIEDDTVSPDLSDIGAENLAPTKDDIGQAIGWHRLASPLLRALEEDQIIVVGTRWFPEDLLQWITDNEPYYKTYQRAARENERGEPDENGQLTFPERFDEKTLGEIEVSLGPYMFSCLYMNKPVRSGDMIFDPTWFTYYDVPPKNMWCWICLDPAGDPEQTQSDPDYSALTVTGMDIYSGMKYVLHAERGRWNPGETLDRLFRLQGIYKPLKVRIETVAYQNTLLFHIRERMKKESNYFVVEGVTHGKKSKGARIQGLQPLVKSGELKFGRGQGVLIGELTSFPLGKNDDLADSLAMHLPIWIATKKKVIEDKIARETGGTFDFNEALRSIARSKATVGGPHSGLRGPLFDTIDEQTELGYQP